MRSATTDFEMYLSHGSIAPASINDAISTNGVMPTYTSHVLFFFFVSAMKRSMPKPATGAIFASSLCRLP